MFIYKITNLINNKVYIGITARTLEERYKQHIYSNKDYPLYKAFKKYGIDNFKIEAIEQCDTRDEACSLEKYYIKLFNSTDKRYGYNQTSGGEDNCGSVNPRATLTDEEVLKIRKYRFNHIGRCKTIHKLFKDKISFSAFEKIWEGTTWRHIGIEYLNVQYDNKDKANIGSQNSNALYLEEEVFKIRQYYVNHTLEETYKKYGLKSKSKSSFRVILDRSYKNIPVYKKVKKEWILNGNIIDINNYTLPVSTILESEE